MSEDFKQQFVILSEQIRKGFEANDRQFRVLKTRMAKMELELQAVRKATNNNTIDMVGIKAKAQA